MPSSKLKIAAETKSKKVEAIHLAVVDPGDGEQIYSIHEPGGETVPLVAIDDRAVEVLTQFAQDEANRSGKVVNIVRFTRRSLHATVRPLSTGDK